MDANNNQMDIESDDSVEEIVHQKQHASVSASVGVKKPSKAQKRKKKLKSNVWGDFTILEVEEVPDQPPELLMCACNKCGKKYVAESYAGTGNLKRHLEKCHGKTTKDIGQYMISSDKGIRNVFKYLEPSVTSISRNTTKSDILKLYECESKRLRAELVRCPGRISLTSDAWTSIVTDGYLSLTAHYTDSNFVLQKRILNFPYMPPPHTGVALAEKISSLVKVGFRLMNSLVYDGKLFHVRCCCHVLNLIVQDGLKEIDDAVNKVRECVKYVKGSQGRKEKFRHCCSQTFLDYKKALVQDVPTRWNSTFRMLTSALYYRLAFCHLSLSDSNFESCPSEDEWVRVEKICDFLSVFYDATLEFSGSRYPTSNLYFPKVFFIHRKLVKELDSSDSYMQKIAGQMWEKFQKYWADFSILLAVAVVFDPRYKYSFLEFSYSKLYGPDSKQLKEVKDAVYGIFYEYMLASNNPSSSASCGASGNEQGNDGDKDTSSNMCTEFDEFDNAGSSGSQTLTQLQLYLAEPRLKTTTKICILNFWKSQQYRYPDLARLAMDIIDVPISTVAYESAFSLGGRILDHYRSSMTLSTAEAIICTRDWLFAENVVSQAGLEDVIQNIMKLDIEKDETEKPN